MKRSGAFGALLTAALLAASTIWVGTAAAANPVPGDPTITLSINDSTAGGSYDQVFEVAYSGTTTTAPRSTSTCPRAASATRASMG